MVHISLLYIFTFFWCSFLLVWYHCSFWSCSISVMSSLSISHISFLESTTAVILHRETLFLVELLMMRTAVRGARGSHSPWVFIFLTYSLGGCWYGWERVFSEPFSLVITSSLRENFALLGRSVLCMFTVVGRYRLRLPVCLFVFILFSLFRHIYTFRHYFGFTLTSGIDFVLLSCYIFFW